MEKQTPESKTVVSLKYDEAKQKLTVVFKYATYEYTPVPKSVAEQAFASDSIGSFVHSHLKGKYVTDTI